MAKYIQILSCILILSLPGCAQTKPSRGNAATRDSVATPGNFKFIKLIPGHFSAFEVDVLDNVYLLTKEKQLKKLDANGDSVAVFNEVTRFGNPSLIDVSNPLKILVYYKNFSTVVVLDRLLARRNVINFRERNIFSVKALSTSYDNNIWLFDEQDFKLKKIDDDGKSLLETTDWRILFDPAPSPSRIIDHENFVYLYDENKGFYIFDYYGSLKNQLPFLHWQHVAVSGNSLYGFVNNVLQRYEFNSLNLKQYAIPPTWSGYTDIKAMNGRLYLLKENGLELYSVQ